MTREEIANALVECLGEVASLLEYSHRIAIREQDALVQNDAEEITVCSKTQDEVLRRIAESDQRAAALTSQLGELTNLDLTDADTDTIANAAGYPYAASIEETLGRISQAAEKLKRQNTINRRLLQNGLEIIACSLRMIATEGKPNSYSKNAHLAESGQALVLSLDLRV